MAGIKSVQIKDKTGATRTVQVDSKAYNNYLADGGTIIPNSSTNISERESDPSRVQSSQVTTAISEPIKSPIQATDLQP